MIDAATTWLTATGAPNGLVLVFLLTSPWTWADKIRTRVGPLVDQLLPGTAGKTRDDDPRE